MDLKNCPSMHAQVWVKLRQAKHTPTPTRRLAIVFTSSKKKKMGWGWRVPVISPVAITGFEVCFHGSLLMEIISILRSPSVFARVPKGIFSWVINLIVGIILIAVIFYKMIIISEVWISNENHSTSLYKTLGLNNLCGVGQSNSFRFEK